MRSTRDYVTAPVMPQCLCSCAMQIGGAIRAARTRAGLTQVQVVERVKPGPHAVITQDVLSRWERGDRVPGLDDVAELERVMGVMPGAILIQAGYVQGVGTVEQAVLADADLDDEGREMLVTAYRAALALAERRHRRSRR